jgi:hypothetical protein
MEDYDESDWLEIGYNDHPDFITILPEELDSIDYENNQHRHSIVFCVDNSKFYKVAWTVFGIEGKMSEGNYMVEVEPVSKTTTVWEEV